MRSTSRPVSHAPPASRTMPASASTSLTPPPRGTGIPPSSIATPITCAMKPGRRLRPDRARCAAPTARTARARARPRTSRSAQSRQLDEDVPGELDEPAAAEAAQRLPRQPRAVPRPELGREHAEREVGVRHELADRALPARPERGDVLLVRGRQEDALAVREERRGRQVGVQVLEPARLEVAFSSAYAAEPVKSGCQQAKTSCTKPGLGDLRGPDRAAEPVVPLEDADAPARLRQQRRRRRAS